MTKEHEDVVRIAHDLLVHDNPVPVDAETIAAAARFRGPGAPWSTVRAMARAAEDPHTVRGRAVQPDLVVPNRTPEDFAAGRDPQLDAAVALLSS